MKESERIKETDTGCIPCPDSMNIAMILSGGTGERFGNNLPKQYNLLLGKEIISYSIDAIKKSQLTDKIIIVAGNDAVNRLSEQYDVECVAGGASRNSSIKNGLDFIKGKYPQCENVFINEAVRPFLTAEIVDIYFSSLNEHDAVITTQYITDSLGREGELVTNRDEYYLIQAPEAFRFCLLYKEFLADSPITATVQQLSSAKKIRKYFDYTYNIKITYPRDLLYAEGIMKTYVQAGRDATSEEKI